MADWKKVVISGSDAELNNLFVTNSITSSVVSSSYIDLDVLANGDIPSHKAGRIFFGEEDGALEVYNEIADFTLQVGQETIVRVYNDSGVTILNGTPVRVSGSQGDRLKIFPATALNHTSSYDFENHIIGVATHDIGIGTEGYATTQGIVRGINTDVFSAGDILFLQTGSPTTPSEYYRNTPPPFPFDIIQVGYVARSASPNGFIYVSAKEPTHFGNISGLSGSVASTGDLWVYQSNNAWTPTKTLSGSYTISGSIESTEGFTGSLFGTSSFAVSASYTENATSASYAITSTSASFSETSTSASFAISASYAPDTTFPYTGSAEITGSLSVTGSVEIYKSGSTVFKIDGSQGELFSITDQLSGSLFSVNDISGIPILEVFSDDTVKLGTFNDEAIIITGNTASITGSLFGTSSWAENSISASYANNATSASYSLTTQADGVDGSIQFNSNNRLASNEDSLFWDNSNSRLGINTNTPSYPLHVQGESGNTSIFAEYDIVAFSDKSVKTNIRPIENVIERIENSRGILYDRTDNLSKDNIGFIAQELEQTFPELVITNPDGTKAVKYQNAVAVLFEAIKQQQKQINQLIEKLK
jgi:hypothetical protein